MQCEGRHRGRRGLCGAEGAVGLGLQGAGSCCKPPPTYLLCPWAGNWISLKLCQTGLGGMEEWRERLAQGVNENPQILCGGLLLLYIHKTETTVTVTLWLSKASGGLPRSPNLKAFDKGRGQGPLSWGVGLGGPRDAAPQSSPQHVACSQGQPWAGRCRADYILKGHQ